MASADVDITARPISRDPSAPDGHPPQAGSNTAAARDELDDLFNYDAQIDNVHRDVENNNTAGVRAAGRSGGVDTANEGGLGIDEEVKVRKPRAPTVKLDEDRLLSEKGIPKLRKITKERLRFRGKGHEFSDVSRLLNLYQLWLDDLFPKAKFADGLAIIEKLGHKKRLQVMRKAWIDEDKPKPTRDDQSEDDDFIERGMDKDVDMNDLGDSQGHEHSSRPENGRQDDSQTHQEREAPSRPNEDDLYGAPSPRPEQTTIGEGQESDGPEEDELDQLLAEDAMRDLAQNNTEGPGSHELNRYDDDEEAMADFGW